MLPIHFRDGKMTVKSVLKTLIGCERYDVSGGMFTAQRDMFPVLKMFAERRQGRSRQHDISWFVSDLSRVLITLSIHHAECPISSRRRHFLGTVVKPHPRRQLKPRQMAPRTV